MDVSRTLYLILVVLGLAFPVRRFAAWFQANGFDWGALVDAVTVTDPARGVAGALLIASTAAVVFMVGECVARGDRVSLIAVPITLILGLAVGLPLYLYLRLRPVD